MPTGCEKKMESKLDNMDVKELEVAYSDLNKEIKKSLKRHEQRQYLLRDLRIKFQKAEHALQDRQNDIIRVDSAINTAKRLCEDRKAKLIELRSRVEMSELTLMNLTEINGQFENRRFEQLKLCEIEAIDAADDQIRNGFTFRRRNLLSTKTMLRREIEDLEIKRTEMNSIVMELEQRAIFSFRTKRHALVYNIPHQQKELIIELLRDSFKQLHKEAVKMELRLRGLVSRPTHII